MNMKILFLLIIPVLLIPVYAQEYSDNTISMNVITVTTDHSSYANGDTIIVKGNIEDYDSFSGKVLTFLILSPDNNIVSLGNIIPNSGGSFEKTLVAGPLWKLAGDYVVEFHYGVDSGETTINYVGGELVITTEPEAKPKANSLCSTGTFYNEQTNSCKLNHIDPEIDHSLQQENTQLKIENKQLKNQINSLKLQLNNLQNIINEQIKVIMDILVNLKSADLTPRFTR